MAEMLAVLLGNAPWPPPRVTENHLAQSRRGRSLYTLPQYASVIYDRIIRLCSNSLSAYYAEVMPLAKVEDDVFLL